MSFKSATESVLSEFRHRPTIRAGSLIITVFGDAIAPRGGTVWIGSLIQALADFGVSERLVRTSVFRLTRDHWLEVNQVGRRSYYSLSAEGATKFEQATERIYGDPRRSWNGDWCLVLLDGVDSEQKDTARKELGWLGFGSMSANVLAQPKPRLPAVEALLKRVGIERQAVVLTGSTPGGKQDDAMRALVHRSWNLADLDRRYSEFIRRFRPVYRAAAKSRRIDLRLAFQVRTLLIQEYRRILLRDPLLPAELLAAGWNGTSAYQLCRNLYRLIYRAADEFMTNALETAEGPLPPPAAEFHRRFGGLD